jgi:hypothetical protein
MKNLDKIVFGLVLAATFPILLAMLSIVIWYYLDGSENNAIYYLFAGISAGLLVDWKFLKDWINRVYGLSIWFVTGIYLFYNTGVYGMFMGFPVFNVLLGIIAGYYFGRRVCQQHIQPEERSGMVRKVSQFTALVMILICITSGYIALHDKYTGGDVRSMLGLDFEVTRSMIWTIILVGGSGLILAQYLLTRLTMIWTIKKSILS